jgi:hypothetical protein
MPEDYRNPNSRRESEKPFEKKTPLLQPANDQVASGKSKTSAPASTLFLIPASIAPACCSRGQVTSYFANSIKELQPRCQRHTTPKSLSPLI